jgi:hypothetical protein
MLQNFGNPIGFCSFDVILAFNPMEQCTIESGQISMAECICAALRLLLCQPMMPQTPMIGLSW